MDPAPMTPSSTEAQPIITEKVKKARKSAVITAARLVRQPVNE